MTSLSRIDLPVTVVDINDMRTWPDRSPRQVAIRHYASDDWYLRDACDIRRHCAAGDCDGAEWFYLPERCCADADGNGECSSTKGAKP